MSNNNGVPVNFYRDSDSSDSQLNAVDPDNQILSLARKYTNQSASSINLKEKDSSDNDSAETPGFNQGADSFGRRLSTTLSRTFTISHIDTNVNPFIDPTDPILDPNNENFNARAWTKHVVRFRDRDPNQYPHKAAGVSFKNLSAFGYGTGTDYQKTVGNIFFEASTIVRKLTGHKGKKVDILQNFDGIIKSGETCVVLGRPGR